MQIKIWRMRYAKKAEKLEAVEEKSEETMDRTPDEQKEAALSDSDEKSMEGTEGESSGEEISQTETENLENKMTLSSGTKEQETDSEMERRCLKRATVKKFPRPIQEIRRIKCIRLKTR